MRPIDTDSLEMRDVSPAYGMVAMGVTAVPVEFIADYMNYKASPYGRIVITDMLKEWLNSKYGLGSMGDTL